jgi:hypothetical protein
MYPGGGYALGWVQIVDRMFRADGGTARQFLGAFTGLKALRRAVSTLPVADADIALTGRRVPWFQEWIRHGLAGHGRGLEAVNIFNNSVTPSLPPEC